MNAYQKIDSCQLVMVADEELMFIGVRAVLQPVRANDGRIVLDFHARFSKSIEEAIGAQKKIPIDVLLLLVRVRHGTTTQMIERLKLQCPGTRILVMGDYMEHEDIEAAVRVGASGYLQRSVQHEELKDIVRKAYYKSDEPIFSDKVAQIEIKEPDAAYKTKSVKKIPFGLTRREVQILQLIADGNTTPEMEKILGITDRTVESHRGNILEKMKAANSANAVKMGYEYGILKNFNPDKDGLFG